jgi:xanthine dehydrogenase accessory factor
MRWLATALTCLDRAQPAMWVVLTTVRGSAPRDAGAALLVHGNGVEGTLGGGTLEYRAIALARALLAHGLPATHVRVPLGPSLGQCCGGLVTVAFKRLEAPDRDWLAALQTASAAAPPVTVTLAITPPVSIEQIERVGSASIEPARMTIARGQAMHEPTAHHRLALTLRGPVLPVLLFGAGHVGRALAQALAPLPVTVTWVDQRDDALPAQVPFNASAVCTDTPLAEVAQAQAGAAFVIATHLHSLDEELAESVLRRADFAYLGVIGSSPKRQRFARRFAARGLSDAQIERMQMPMGTVSSKEPEVIAASVAAELMQVRARQRGVHSPTNIATNDSTWTSTGPTSSTG